ncbi:MAG: DNA repair protein RadA [Candidatus Firestonebacteria bacterium]|nr:DNA repair protein RadA [Candidatus Firestonebacteria bacterium]
MAKEKTTFFCQECGFESIRWQGKCPGCGKWSSMVEETVVLSAGTSRHTLKKENKSVPHKLNEIEDCEDIRFYTNIKEFDRILGGGFVPGSLILLGGEPGIGKSTLLLQISLCLEKQGKKVLYVSGEESLIQIKMRAARIGVNADNFYILAETAMEEIEQEVIKLKPDILIIDSIQTLYKNTLSSAPGSVSQIRECTANILYLSKNSGITTIIVGHITKDGNLAGPKILEHMVDTVLYFEGEEHQIYRILRAYKNRFGSVNELGMFEMGEKGLKEVENPSEIFLSERPMSSPGSIVAATIEGTRPLLIELQALLSPTNFGYPQRMVKGLDYNRLALIIAVLEKKLGLSLGNYDIFVNVPGGVKIDDPAVDLGIALSIVSSFRNKTLREERIAVAGEVGLTGEIRGIIRAENRINEAFKLGFSQIIIPQTNYKNLQNNKFKEIKILGISSLENVIEAVF